MKYNIKGVVSITESPIQLECTHLDHHQILARDNDDQDLTPFFKQTM